jgi:hypothetical protein
MATTTRTRTKAAPKPAPAPEPEPAPEPASKKAERAARNGELTEKVLEMRADGKKWQEIADELTITPGKAMFLDMKAQVASSPKLKITWTDEDDLAEKVVNARTEDQLSWGQISARTGLGEGKLKKVFSSAAGDIAHGHRIGKGGRFPRGSEPAPKPAGKEKANGATKAGGATKKPGTTTTRLKPLLQCNFDELSARLNGKSIKVMRNGKETRLGVKTLKEFKDGTISFISDRGQTRSVKLEEISVTRSA